MSSDSAHNQAVDSNIRTEQPFNWIKNVNMLIEYDGKKSGGKGEKSFTARGHTIHYIPKANQLSLLKPLG